MHSAWARRLTSISRPPSVGELDLDSRNSGFGIADDALLFCPNKKYLQDPGFCPLSGLVHHLAGL